MKVAIITARTGTSKYQSKALKEVLDFHTKDDEFILSGEQSDKYIIEGLKEAGRSIVIYTHGKQNIDELPEGVKVDKEHSPNPQERNKRMINEANEIIAFPQMVNESEDSVCWKTIRYAKLNGKKLTIVSPAGWVYDVV